MARKPTPSQVTADPAPLTESGEDSMIVDFSENVKPGSGERSPQTLTSLTLQHNSGLTLLVEEGTRLGSMLKIRGRYKKGDKEEEIVGNCNWRLFIRLAVLGLFLQKLTESNIQYTQQNGKLTVRTSLEKGIDLISQCAKSLRSEICRVVGLEGDTEITIANVTAITNNRDKIQTAAESRDTTSAVWKRFQLVWGTYLKTVTDL